MAGGVKVNVPSGVSSGVGEISSVGVITGGIVAVLVEVGICV